MVTGRLTIDQVPLNPYYSINRSTKSQPGDKIEKNLTLKSSTIRSTPTQKSTRTKGEQRSREDYSIYQVINPYLTV
jgi:hypothetical protein